MCAALVRVESELVGLPGKVITRDATRRLRFAAMQPVGCTPWCSTDGDVVWMKCKLLHKDQNMEIRLMEHLPSFDIIINNEKHFSEESKK